MTSRSVGDARLDPLGPADGLDARDVGGHRERGAGPPRPARRRERSARARRARPRPGRGSSAPHDADGDADLPGQLPVHRPGRGHQHPLDLAEQGNVSQGIAGRPLGGSVGPCSVTRSIVGRPGRSGRRWLQSGSVPGHRPDLLVRVTDEPLDPSEALGFVADPGAGGTVLFSGTVRDHSDAGDVTGPRLRGVGGTRRRAARRHRRRAVRGVARSQGGFAAPRRPAGRGGDLRPGVLLGAAPRRGVRGGPPRHRAHQEGRARSGRRRASSPARRTG